MPDDISSNPQTPHSAAPAAASAPANAPVNPAGTTGASAPMPAAAPSATPAAAPAPARTTTPYVRQRPSHQSMGTIDDYANEKDEIPNVTHDSGYTNPGNPMTGRSYKRSRAQGEQLRRNLHYGQYLEIPKGRRDIFVSREKNARIKTIVALVVVLVVLVVVGVLLWNVMQSNWG